MKTFRCSIGVIELEAQDKDEAMEFAVEAFNRKVNKEYINDELTITEVELNKFVKTTSGFVSQTFEKNANGKFVCISQVFTAGDNCDYEDVDGDSIDPPEYSYQAYGMYL